MTISVSFLFLIILERGPIPGCVRQLTSAAAFGAGRRICPGAKLGENTLDIGLMNLLWAFEVRPPLMDDGTEATTMNMDFDTAFEPTAFAAPKPFAVRFIPRSEKALRMVQEQWERGLREGYMLGKNHVTAAGVGH